MQEYIEKAGIYSKSGAERLALTWQSCKWLDDENIQGDLVECGVWRGGNIMVMRWASPERTCWLYDTFAGMTEPGEQDVSRSGCRAQDKYDAKKMGGTKWADASFKEVCQNLISMKVYDAFKLKFIEGDVRRTLKDELNLPKKIALLRLDTDFYDSTKIEMEILYPRLQRGGILIVDDYGHWMGSRKAVSDYLGEASSELKPVDYTCSWLVKP